jgi:PIN domain
MAAPPKKTSAGLESRHIFLDTEVYKRYGHNLSDKVLQRLLQLTKDHISTLHITDITLEEVKRQLGDMAAEVAQAVNKGNRLLRNWRSIRSWQSESQPVPANVDSAALAQDAVRNFSFTMLVEWRPTRHDALNISAGNIFNLYFRREPPFDKADSKEFPDAFVVAALDSWCRNEHEKMYVVTKDKAMLRAVQKTNTLLPLPTLEDYLALFVDDPKIVEEVEGIFNSSAWDTVEEQVREELGDLGTVYTGDLHDGEVIYHQAGDGPVELVKFDVISASDDQIEVVAKVKAPIVFDVQYLDTTSAWWDSEDKEFIGGEKEVQKLDLEMTLSVLIIIDPQAKMIEQVDMLTRDVNVREPYEDFK